MAYTSTQDCEPDYSRGPLTAVKSKSSDRRIGDAATIRDQVAECAKLAANILDRTAGSQPETCGETCDKELPCGGFLGDLASIQSSTISNLSDLRFALEQLSNHI